jgi:hypothetical protein
MKTHHSLAFAFIFAVTGCAGNNGVSVVENEQSGFYSGSEYGHDLSEGPVLVRVAGTAFNMDPQSFTNRVVENMQGADWSPHARFTAVPSPNTARIYSYAMMFGSSPAVTGANLCAASDAPNATGTSATSAPPRTANAASGIAGSSGALTLVAALCRYDKPTMGVTARVADAGGPDDPRFRSLVRSAVLELTRPNQNNIQHDRDNGGNDSHGSDHQ